MIELVSVNARWLRDDERYEDFLRMARASKYAGFLIHEHHRSQGNDTRSKEIAVRYGFTICFSYGNNESEGSSAIMIRHMGVLP